MARKKTNDCECGCGTKVAGRFALGHDAQLHGTLLKKLRGGTPGEKRSARASLRKLGWSTGEKVAG